MLLNSMLNALYLYIGLTEKAMVTLSNMIRSYEYYLAGHK